jgi:hypothetical protein
VLALTFGAGRKNPRGRRRDVAPDPAAIAAALSTYRTPGNDPWWSPHTWRDDHRIGPAWEAASGVPVDVDFLDGEGTHVETPADVAEMILGAAQSGRLPGNLFHLTPRGFRLVFVFPEPVRDPEGFKAAASGAGVLVQAALDASGASGTPGFEIDRKALLDLARFLFAPNGVVLHKVKDEATGESRDVPRERAAEVVLMRPEPIAPQVLAAAVQAPVPVQQLAPRQLPAIGSDFADAVRRWNDGHSREYPRSEGECPACGHKGCFGQLPSDNSRWACFSASHGFDSGRTGIEGQGCWHGDALDLEARLSNMTRRDVLVRDGYLDPPAPRHPTAAVAGVEAVATPRVGIERNSYASVCRIIREDSRIVSEPLEWNEMLCAPTIGGTAVDQHMLNDLRERIELVVHDEKGRPIRPTIGDVTAAVGAISNQSKYHPVREYLRSVEGAWDGKRRIDRIAGEVLGALGPLDAAIVRTWMIAAVARVMTPGCKFDGMLILQGDQGVRKSTFFRTMAGPDWFSDSPIEIGDRDAAMLLRKVWMLELGELESMIRASPNAVKGWISQQHDDFREPYGRSVITAPRHCVIVGTSNETEFLTDATGNRRFWVVPVPKGWTIRTDVIRTYRDQLWGEAVNAWRADPEQILDLEPEHAASLRDRLEEYAAHDPWEEQVVAWTRKNAGTTYGPTTLEVLTKALDIPAGRVSKSDKGRIANILKIAGFRFERTRRGDDRRYEWIAPVGVA